MVKYGVTVKVCAIKSCSFPLSDPFGSRYWCCAARVASERRSPSESPAAIVGTMRWQCPSLQHEGFDVNR